MLSRIFLIIAGVFSLETAAQNAFHTMTEVDSFQERMQEASRKTRSISSDFIQERHISMMTQPIISKGTFHFKRPASIRWEYTEPYSHVIILTRRRVYVQDDSQTTEFDMGANDTFKELGRVMFRFVLGDLTAAEEDFYIDYLENESTYFIKLRPKNKKDDTARPIDLYFDKKDYSLSQIVLYDTNEDYTQITFVNKTLNESVSNDLFRP